MIYPNLSEIIQYHPYHISTFTGFADVTTELLEAVIRGEEDLTVVELLSISQYSGIPMSVMICPKTILLDKNRAKHREMVKGLCDHLTFIAQKEKAGSYEAKMFMRYHREGLVNLELAFLDGRATYGRYLGVKERVEQTISFIRNEEKRPRGIREASKMKKLNNNVFACQIKDVTYPNKNDAGEPLALWCDLESGDVILIEDHPNYRINEMLIPEYLGLDAEGRSLIKQAFGKKYESVRRALVVADEAIKIRLNREKNSSVSEDQQEDE